MAEWYTVDDLQSPRASRRVVWFADWRAALADYRALPATTVKALGVSSEAGTADLVRCLPVFPLDREGEDVLVTDTILRPEWSECKDVARELVSELHIRYCLKDKRLLPRPERASKKIMGKQLWSAEQSVRWLYVAGVGGLSPAEFERRYANLERGGFCYPLVLKLQVEVRTKDGSFAALEVSPWDYERLKVRSSTVSGAPRSSRPTNKRDY